MNFHRLSKLALVGIGTFAVITVAALLFIGLSTDRNASPNGGLFEWKQLLVIVGRVVVALGY